MTKPKPSLPKRALNLGKAIIRNTGSVLKGNDFLVSEEEMAKRLVTCEENACECFIEEENICAECGCFLELKTRLLAEHCPQYRWPGDLQRKLGERND